MPDAHEQLTAEYERLMQAFKNGQGQHYLTAALLHILKRLGPPSLTEASEIERREAIASE